MSPAPSSAPVHPGDAAAPPALRWAVLGPGAIARRFASQLPASRSGRLVAVGSSDPARARAFAEEFGGGGSQVRAGSYEEVLADPGVDAVYVATVHTAHARLAVAAARAGKHLLVEKPLTPNHGSAMAVVDAARRAGVALVEAYMYRFHEQTRTVLDLVRSGALGELLHVDASFSFDTGGREGRLFDVDVAGGGILDVGGYPVTYACALAGAEPTGLRAVGTLGPTGVDEFAAARLEFPGGLTATVRTGVRLADPESVVVTGARGVLTVSDPWTFRGGGRVELRVAGEEPRTWEFPGDDPAARPYAREADALARAAAGERVEFTPEDSLATARVLDRWRAAVGLRYPFERDDAPIPTVSGLPLVADRSAMRYGEVAGVAKPLSRLVMGVDNQPDLAHASALFDAFFEAGGNTFDTSWWYGRGWYEKLFGQWMANRGVRDEVVAVLKGAHTPECTPEGMTRQLLESLENQQHDRADVYMLHRDNPDVPVGEFVDALDEHAEAGRIGVFGGSNWSPARVDEANAWAAAHGKRGFTVLSNHFGLAEALDVPWAGCEHVTDEASKRWLTERQIPLLPWSSQARGFFARADEDDRSDAELVRCYYSGANFERKRRAEQLGRELGVPATAVALAFVLHQPFPTFPLVGPRSVTELRWSLSALEVELTAEQVAWLDLRD